MCNMVYDGLRYLIIFDEKKRTYLSVYKYEKLSSASQDV